MRVRTWWATLGAVAIILAVAAVGVANGFAQTASPAAGTPMASPAVSPSAGLTVDLEDIFFEPKELTIPANTAAKITLPNKGAAVHDFNIDALNVHSGQVAPGATGEVTITAAPGDYQYYCNEPGHKEAGMVGTLHVK